MATFRRTLTLALIAGAFTVSAAFAQDDESFDLTLIHTNDEHAYHTPNSNGDGGQARLATVIDQIRASVANSLLVDAGDRFTGTLFHQLYRGQDNAQIMNLLGYEVMTLGNHEFDDGDDVLAAFIEAVNFPVVSANVTVPEDNPLSGLYTSTVTLEVGGEQIGIIGLTTAETAYIASPGEGVEFNEDYATVVNEAAAGLTEAGVNKIILLSHIGLGVDLDLAPQLVGVDVIVGGHSHTLMSNAYTAANGVAYPAEVLSAAEEPIAVVQAGGGDGLYVGQLNLTFDGSGILTDWGGDTIFLSRFITPDPEVEALIADLEGPIEELRATPVGDTQVFLVGDRSVCRVTECNLGNLITDAIREFSGAQIAITNGGGIRSNVPQEGTLPADLALSEPYAVTLGDVLTVLPFGNLTATFSLTGADVVAALEHGVSAVGSDSGTGRFPQVSGLRFTFDPAAEIGSRIVSVEVLNDDGTYSAIDPEATYSVVSNDFLRRGGDGYTVFAENAIDPYDFGTPMDQVVADYIESNSPVNPQIEGRIITAGQ